MKFLCQTHRQWLENDTEKALQLWHKATVDARQGVRDENWRAAIVNYGNAFDIAELLLESQSSDPKAQERYAYTAVEMAYTFKINQLDRRWILQSVKHTLGNVERTSLTQELLRTLVNMDAPTPENVHYLWQPRATSELHHNHSRRLH